MIQNLFTRAFAIVAEQTMPELLSCPDDFGECKSGIFDAVRSIRFHQMQQRIADGEREQVIDHVEHDELADLSPDFSFVSGADVHQQGIQHFARIIAGQDSFEAAADGRVRDVDDVRVLEHGFLSQPQQNADLLGGKSRFAGCGPAGRTP